MTESMVSVAEVSDVQLRCPYCGNRGERPFSVDAYMEVDGAGQAVHVDQWTEVDREGQRVGCHQCDLIWPSGLVHCVGG